MFNRITLSILALLLIFSSTGLNARIINVPDDFETIQAGINEAEDGDTVLVHPGTYAENTDFTGKNILVASLLLTTGDAAYIDSTIIDGNRSGTVVTLANEETEAAKLVGFTIRNGMVEENGGGISIIGASPEIRNCHIIENSAGSRGGGIFISQECSPLFKECIIAGNLSVDCGGGVAVDDHACPRLENCLICGNMTDGFEGWYLAAENGSYPILINCTMSWQPIYGWTYAVFCSASDLIIVNSIIWGDSPLSISFAPDGNPSSITIAYSDIADGRGSIDTNDNGEVNWLDGNLTDNPRYVDYYGGDYHLAEDSPCIDSGTAFFVWEDDTLLNRSGDDYQGNAPDMGAFESPYTHSAPDFILHPSSFSLYPAYPNPFNAATRISFDLPAECFIKLHLYDIQGREAAVIAEGRMPAGRHGTTLNAENLAAGVYFVRLEAGENVATVKIVNMR